MTGTAFATVVRAAALVLVLIAAAASGLVVGNAIQGRGPTDGGYPEGWLGRAVAPRSITADAAFSLDAIAAVQAARGDAQTPDYVDFGLRHLAVDATGTGPSS